MRSFVRSLARSLASSSSSAKKERERTPEAKKERERNSRDPNVVGPLLEEHPKIKTLQTYRVVRGDDIK